MEKGDRGSSENGIAPTGRGRLIVQAGAIVAATAATLGLLVWIAGRQAPTSDPFAQQPSGVSWQWFKEPLETNRFLRLPSVSQDLTAVMFLADGQRGWTVGSGGTILSTRDGGSSWQRQMSGSGAWLTAVTFLADGQRGWAVGSGGTILSTRDSGTSWQAQSSGNKVWLTAVTFLADGQRGWAVGSGGTILSTRDGGRSWQPQTSGSEAGLIAVTFLADGQRGWAVGSGGTILSTRDGGGSWWPQTSASGEGLTAVTFLADGQRGWAVGSGGTILSTRDAGVSWRPQTIDSKAWLKAVTFLADGQRGWVVGDDGTVLSTRDGGGSWQVQSSGTEARLFAVMFLDDGQRGWAVGSEGTILSTQDGGTAWQARTSGRKDLLFQAVTFLVDGQRGWAVGNDGTILSTRDGGNSWQPQTSGSEAWLTAVTFLADGRRGWALGNNGTIVSAWGSRGLSRQPQTSGGKAWLFEAVTFLVDGQRGWAVGDNGTILSTRDGGTSWQSQLSGSEADLRAVTFLADGQRGWAVGDTGTILSTLNGGNSWQPQTSGSEAFLTAVTFLADSQRGWVVGSLGTILSTQNGGKSWQTQSSGSDASLTAVTFLADGQRGWAVGSDGMILSTRDGGTSWKPQISPSKAGLTAVTFLADGQRGWAVGSAGTILGTRDGGATWVAAAYNRYPAPWFYPIVCLDLATAMVLAWRLRRQGVLRVTSIDDKGESDQPITSVEQDRLGFADLARGLVRYLRNRATRPPLTIALNAPWGRGKSSVMHMLRSEFVRARVRTAWFNAWHNQKERIALAAMLTSICEQALPPYLSWLGLRFRVRLLLQRVRRRPERWLLCFAVLLLPLGHLGKLLGGLVGLLGADSWTAFALDHFASVWRAVLDLQVPQNLLDGSQGGFLSRLFTSRVDTTEHLLDLLALAAWVGGLLVLFLYGLRAFPDPPAVLLASLSSRFKLSAAQRQTAFRQNFREDFSDVCKALLPRTLVVFIDDLDRCEPGKIAEMLEAVNYLVDSGPCFVVLGMARDVVEAQLADHYKNIADARRALRRVDSPEESTLAKADGDVDQDRVAYARDYLRKLINLEVYIPALSVDRVRSLLGIEALEQEDQRGWRQHALRASETVLGWLNRGGRRAIGWALVLPLLGWGLYSLSGDTERWNRNQVALLQRSREEATVSLGALRDAERRARAAWVHAKSREQAAAVRLFADSGTPVAGLDLDLARARKRTLGMTDPCKVKPDASGLPAAPSGKGRRAKPSALACWRDCDNGARKAEELVTEIRKLVEKGETANARDDFRRLNQAVADASVAATLAESVAKLDRVSSAQADSGTVGQPDSNKAVREKPPLPSSAVEAMVLRHADPPQWPAQVPALALLVLVVVGLRAATEVYVIDDAPSFQTALGLWAPVVAAKASLAAPREVKRFQNKARYYAMRLRPERQSRWLRQVLLGNEGDGKRGQTRVDEALIVALTALLHVADRAAKPQELASLVLGAPSDSIPGSDQLGASLREAVVSAAQAHVRAFGAWPANLEEIEPFLAVAGEYRTHNAASAASPTGTHTQPHGNDASFKSN